jgi:hypothetical protein
LAVANDTQALLAEIPAACREWVISHGDGPVETWVNQRLTDLLLNRGRSPLPDLIRRLDQSQDR